MLGPDDEPMSLRQHHGMARAKIEMRASKTGNCFGCPQTVNKDPNCQKSLCAVLVAVFQTARLIKYEKQMKRVLRKHFDILRNPHSTVPV